MVVHRLVRWCCGILIKRFAAKQGEMPEADWTMCDAASQVPSVYRSFTGTTALSWD
jgi:hypothetical protein